MDHVSIDFCNIAPFQFSIQYNSGSIPETSHQHIHSECEIYINLTGDVSFMVEDSIYPVSHGTVILARPYEYHHCIYRSSAPHGHFWILFDSNGNEDLLPVFFRRGKGEGNLISLSETDSKRLIDICYAMLDGDADKLRNYIDFLSMIEILNSGAAVNARGDSLPPDFLTVLDYVNANYKSAITVSEIAETAFMSVNTLERKFKKYLNISPYAYIHKKRLACALQMLHHGASVSRASSESGFSDGSLFIRKFKEKYGMTPLQFQKNLNR